MKEVLKLNFAIRDILEAMPNLRGDEEPKNRTKEVKQNEDFCDFHKNEKSVIYCMTCMKKICVNCVIIDAHQNQDKIRIEEAKDIFNSKAKKGNNKIYIKRRVLKRNEKFPIIRCGSYHSLILLGSFIMDESFIISENGTLLSCGYNSSGQLGQRDTINRNTLHKITFDKNIIQISAGFYHTLVLTSLNFLKIRD